MRLGGRIYRIARPEIRRRCAETGCIRPLWQSGRGKNSELLPVTFMGRVRAVPRLRRSVVV
jgi:hypothetical protein